MFATEVAWSQILGERKSQQDYAAIVSWPNGFRLLLLGDGMGGHIGGDIASRSVLETFRDHFVHSEQADMRLRMIESLDVANKELYQMAKAQPELTGMGTTLIALIYDGSSIQWLSVGDSPMWLVRGGNITRINQNHSMSEILAAKVQSGEMSPEEAARSPLRTQLLEAVMGENINMLDAPDSIIPLQEGDWLILASDGVESCEEKDILKLTEIQPNSPEIFTLNLLKAVSDVGKPSQDNASVVVMQVLGKDTEEPDTVQPANGKMFEEPPTSH